MFTGVTHERRTMGEATEVSIQAPDPLSFEVFFIRERSRLFGTLRLVSGDRAEAEELGQEAFLRVWERWDKVTATSDPGGYLYQVAFNLARERRRRLRRAAKRLVTAAPFVDTFVGIDERTDVLEAIRSLTPRQRAALVLTDLVDMSSEQAAKALGVRPVTVRVLASQGRARLRDVLGGTYG
jgi:RNA polymerase sigma-70 factor (ECF subfamily)